MNHETSEKPQGYPPVTESEEQKAAESVGSTAPPAAEAKERYALKTAHPTIGNEMTAVIDKYRAAVTAAPVSPETRSYALNLLDAVLLDALEINIDKTKTH